MDSHRGHWPIVRTGARWLGEVAASSSLDPLARECRFPVMPTDHDTEVDVDPEMLAAAVGKLLQNAFMFTKRQSEVRLHTQVEGPGFD
jgi:hypothetical protein